MSRLGERDLPRAAAVVRRLKALDSAVTTAHLQRSRDECEDVLPALIGFAMQSPEIDAKLHWAYGQDAYGIDSEGPHVNSPVLDSLAYVGGVLDECLYKIEPLQRVGAAISLLSRNTNELWIRKASQDGPGHWLDDWIFVEIDRLLWDLEDGFARADLVTELDFGGDAA